MSPAFKNERDPEHYRPCVGTAVFNQHGQIWLGKRMNHDGPFSWQMPQGGMDAGEIPETSAARELFEETGMTLDMVTPIGGTQDWLYYDFPPEYTGKSITKNWRGQRQKWFAFRFHGHTSNIDLKSHGLQEFSEWRWANFFDTPALIIPFKRDVYEQLTLEFERFAYPIK